MNRETFVTLNKTRLFTADQVVDIVQSGRDKVLDDVISLINKNCFELEGKRLKITPLLLIQEINKLRQAGEP